MFVPLELILGVERGTSRSVSGIGPECVVSDKHARVEFYGCSIHISVTSAETEIQSYARCKNSIKSISRVLNKNNNTTDPDCRLQNELHKLRPIIYRGISC